MGIITPYGHILRVGIIVPLFWGLIFCCFFVGWGYAEDGAKEQIVFIGTEIDRIQNDLDWLKNKISKIESQGRLVPGRMSRSVEFKRAKLKALGELLAQYKKQLPSSSPSKKIVEKKGVIPKPLAGNVAGDNSIELWKRQLSRLNLDGWFELISNSDGSFRIENRLPILFRSASVKVPSGYKTFLKKVSDLIKGRDVLVVVDGYADADPIHTPEYPSNFELGAARAGAVVRHLVKHGVKPALFKIRSSGEHRDGRKTSNWKKLQRHVDISIFIKGS